MPDHLPLLCGLIWAGCALIMLMLWLVQWVRQDASVVDAGWAFAVGCGALCLLALGHGDGVRRLVAGVLIAGWSARLTIHLLCDRVIGKDEDGRYRMLRARWAERAQRRFFLFFQLQALLAALFSLPLLAVTANSSPFGGWSDVLGLVVWACAITGEHAADRQLAAFRSSPGNRGRTCRSGWWRLSRHPNYFFEWLHWWAYVALGGAHPESAIALFIPILLLVLLLRVTGIPYSEARALLTRGDDYRAYQRTTSAFIPWFPRRPPPIPEPS